MGFWSRRRFRITPLRALVALFLVSVLFWLTLDGQMERRESCAVPEEFTEKLHDLSNRVHLVLAKLGIVHFLCFGGLWGQARIGRALPWAGLAATYMHAAGIYRVQEQEVGEDAPKVEIVVFEEDLTTQMVRRVGWTRRVLPPDCELSPSLQCFPPQLAISPLPMKKFGSHSLPVPREGIELQKYHYPDNWWLEIKPTNCIEQGKPGKS
ncbi:uncharacterized protein LOC105687470 isoform X2 [Athalia rosae]|uniref:uncharacterized protein LOC105687470 isoform X2 n=1 Tax=Athalia rosae TaxID=37344 RepID=UPI002033BB4D|nr:uncharacterized protein LOC105687470 isoform X2 [Athalia rosae]